MPNVLGPLKVNPVGLAETLRGANGPVVRHLIVQAEKVKIAARAACPVGTVDPVPRKNPKAPPGTLRDSIVKRVIPGGPNGFVVVVGSSLPYALYVHEGTQPHVITPKKAPRLVFFWGKAGKIVAFPRVNHPGNKPNRFLLRALLALRG